MAYAWYVLDSATAEVAADATPVSTSATYTVAAADAGKYIRVNVQGDGGSAVSATTTAPVVAEEGAKIAISSAQQTGASKIEVPLLFHQFCMESAANSDVSWLIPTVTCAVLLFRQYTPFGITIAAFFIISGGTRSLPFL